MEKVIDVEFTFPRTPGNVAAMEELKRKFMDAPCTLYGVDENGNTFPVMNITKHPDCPDGWYEAMLKRFLNFREGEK